MATTDLMISDYGRPIRCSAQAAAVISARLHKAAPEGLDAQQLKALALVAHRADLVAEVQSDRDRVGPARLRPALSIYANGWSAFFEALVAASRVPVHVSDRGEKATAIVRSLFPDGISFTQLDAESAWSEGNRRLQRVIEEELTEQINQLIGPDFLATATTATAHLADTIGTGDAPRRRTSTKALLEALTSFGRAVGGYGRAMAASCDEDDEESVARFVAAMLPIDEHRASVGRGGNDDPSAEDQIVTPVVVAPVVTPVSTPVIAPVVALPLPPVAPVTPVAPLSPVVSPSPFINAHE